MISAVQQPGSASIGAGNELEGVRIARISTVAFFLVTQLKDQVERLAGMGADLTLICSPGPELEQLSLGQGLRYVPVRIERSIRPLQDLVALITLIRLFRRERFDIIHTTTPKAGLLAGLAAYLARSPVRLHTYTGQVWVTQRGLTRWLARFSDQVVGWLSTQCYADSPSQRDFLVGEGVVSEKKLSVIGEGSLAGVDLRRFDPARFDETDRAEFRKRLGIPPTSTVFLFIGRIALEKGVRVLLHAFEKIREEGFDVALVMVGPLNDECGGEPSITAQDLRGRLGIHYVGFRERPEEFMAFADVLCLPSFREGFGTVIIEAAAMAVPSIGSRIVGLIDAIQDGETGLLVEPRSPAALYDVMRRLIAEPELGPRLGAAARARCTKVFDSDRLARATADAYLRSLVKKKGMV